MNAQEMRSKLLDKGYHPMWRINGMEYWINKSRCIRLFFEGDQPERVEGEILGKDFGIFKEEV